MKRFFIRKIAANVMLVLYLTAATAMAAPPLPAGPSNEQWKYLGANDKGEQFFYDAASIVSFSKDLIQVWTRELAPNTAPTRRLREINCSFKIIRDRQVIVEKAGNKGPRQQNALSPWHAMENDPVTKKMYETLCR